MVNANKKVKKIKAFKNIFFNFINRNESKNNIIPILSIISPLKKSKLANFIYLINQQKKQFYNLRLKN